MTVPRLVSSPLRRIALAPLVSLAFLAGCLDSGNDPSLVLMNGDGSFVNVIASASGTCAPAVGATFAYPVHLELSKVLDDTYPAGHFYLLHIQGLPGASAVQQRFTYPPYEGSSFFLSTSYAEGNVLVRLGGSLEFTSGTRMTGTVRWTRHVNFVECAGGESVLTIRQD